jgi:hypothetical protein
MFCSSFWSAVFPSMSIKNGNGFRGLDHLHGGKEHVFEAGRMGRHSDQSTVGRPDYVRFLWAEEHHDLKHGRDHVHTIKDLFQSETSQRSQRSRTDWIIKTETPNHIRFNEFAQDVTNFETKVRTTAREWIDCEVFESKEGWICSGVEMDGAALYCWNLSCKWGIKLFTIWSRNAMAVARFSRNNFS